MRTMRGAAICVGCVVALSAWQPASLGQTPSPRPPGFTEAQASAGAAAYRQHCASCHGAPLEGQHLAPGLTASGSIARGAARRPTRSCSTSAGCRRSRAPRPGGLERRDLREHPGLHAAGERSQPADSALPSTIDVACRPDDPAQEKTEPHLDAPVVAAPGNRRC